MQTEEPNQIQEFIRKHRDRTADEFNNTFALAFSQCSRYYRFLQIISGRYCQASSDYIEDANAIQADPTHRDHDRSVELSFRLHLEVESFYVFAKLFLDRTADALAYFFGFKWGGLGSTFSKLAEKYGGKRQFHRHLPSLPTDLEQSIAELKKSIVEHKTDSIEHVQQAGLTHATSYSLVLSSDGNPRVEARILPMIVGASAYAISHHHTLTPDEIFLKLESYLTVLLGFLEAHIESSPLFPKAAAPRNLSRLVLMTTGRETNVGRQERSLAVGRAGKRGIGQSSPGSMSHQVFAGIGDRRFRKCPPPLGFR